MLEVSLLLYQCSQDWVDVLRTDFLDQRVKLIETQTPRECQQKLHSVALPKVLLLEFNREHLPDTLEFLRDVLVNYQSTCPMFAILPPELQTIEGLARELGLQHLMSSLRERSDWIESLKQQAQKLPQPPLSHQIQQLWAEAEPM